jgi:BASS family bile acid:Na+ symporter
MSRFATALDHAVTFLIRRANLLVPISISTGLAFPEAAEWLKPILAPTIVVFLLLGMIRVPWEEVLRLLHRPRAAALGILWMLVLVPLAVGAVGRWSGIDPSLAAALMIGTAGPALTVGPSLAALFGLNAGLALVATVGSLLVLPLTLPMIADLATGGAVTIPVFGLFLRTFLTVGGSFALSLAVRRFAGAHRLQRNARFMDATNIVLLVVFAVAVMNGVTHRFEIEPLVVVRYVFAAFAANFVVQLATALLFSNGLRDGLTLALVSGNRNTAILLAIVPPPIDPAIALFVAAAQLPIYILPFTLEPAYRRILHYSLRKHLERKGETG